MSSFHYPPLAGTDYIRVLVLEPGEDTEPLTARFAERDLGDSSGIPYESLSYTWNDPGGEKAITIDGNHLKIRPNLYDFLARLRGPHESRVLWADFICIDQHDLNEKARQVELMSAIYASATCVLAWVGEHANGSETLFRSQLIPSTLPDTPRKRIGIFPTSLSNRTHRKEVWLSFLARRYWTRTWIVQELVLAQRILLHCGADVVSWDDLFQSRVKLPLDGLNDIYRHQRAARLDRPSFDLDRIAFRESYTDQLHLVRTICCERYLIKDTNPADDDSLVNPVLKYAVLTQCLKPLDKIFAFIAMQNMPEHSAVVPDYKASPAQLLVTLWKSDCETVHPLPCMNLLNFTFKDDCHFVDFLLDEHEGHHNELYDNDYHEALKTFCNSFLDGVQAIHDSSLRSSNPRLGHILAQNVEWYKQPFRRSNGQGMTPEERGEERERRYKQEKHHLGEIRDSLRAQGRWATPRNMAARRAKDGGRTRPSQRDRYVDESLDARRFSGERVWLRGTQPERVGNRSKRPPIVAWWCDLFGDTDTDRANDGEIWKRPSVIDTSVVQEELELAEYQKRCRGRLEGHRS